MKFLSSLVVALAALPAALAMNQKMPAIVYFSEDSTPDSVIEKAKKTLIEAGGKITHTYTIIKGFAVIAPEKALQALQKVQAWGTDYGMTVEEDKGVTTQ
ncbi:M protein repeat protein, partial [Metarhizium majus ARSEF 297]|uniref:M protein repeat protein n=1 Tax=Metarhizium guizhouense (strain ARSEF 977) TaxID=1276136 RepID=A0A0B4HFW7_METGA